MVEESDVALSPVDSDPVAVPQTRTILSCSLTLVKRLTMDLQLAPSKVLPTAGTLSTDGQAPIVMQGDDTFLFTATEEPVADTPTPDAGADLSVPGDEIDALPSTLSSAEVLVEPAGNDNTSSSDDPWLVA